MKALENLHFKEPTWGERGEDLVYEAQFGYASPDQLFESSNNTPNLYQRKRLLCLILSLNQRSQGSIIDNPPLSDQVSSLLLPRTPVNNIPSTLSSPAHQ